MVFEYTPSVDSVVESFWSLSIPAQGIVVPFLLVGLVLEPRVAFARPSLGFGQVQLGVTAKQVSLAKEGRKQGPSTAQPCLQIAWIR
jgi:hypothetical protein